VYRALQEVAILSRLRHPYVIRHKEAFLDAGALLIVMEYAEGGMY
jgi:serine/threonine protein kinase